MKLTAKVIKYILMNKFRFKDGLMVTSECDGHGNGIADIITYNRKKGIMVEIEIKISKQDLKRDIKKIKHFLYEDRKSLGIQRFYYAVPSNMTDYCEEFLDKNNLPYGIIEILHGDGFDWSDKQLRDTSNLMRVHRKCKRFNSNSPSELQIHSFMLRISSELVTREKELLCR